MAAKRTIKRIVLTALWVAITGGVITLLVAANGRQQKRHCQAVHITVKGMGERYFISKEDIAKWLRPDGASALKGQPVEELDLARLEGSLEENAWIEDAELYFDRDDELHVLVTERQPIARVFARNGTSFYIDSAGMRLPLLPHISARVPVVTGYPSARKPAGPRDSAIVKDVRNLVQYISSHEFWGAQIAQIDIMPDWTLELMPTVGNHTIKVGSAEKVPEKLARLGVFYRKVLSRAGFDKYAVLDVQYAGQVVAVHRGTQAAVDSVQLQKNIASLLQSDQMMKAHASAQTRDPVQQSAEVDGKVAPAAAAPVKAAAPAPKAAVPVTKKPPAALKKTPPAKPKGGSQPKAVMPRKPG